jgi:ribosome-binding protein aMBF1 (putative translation factor)
VSETIRERIVAARQHAGLSQAALAKALKVHTLTVYSWEHREYWSNLVALKAVERVCEEVRDGQDDAS